MSKSGALATLSESPRPGIQISEYLSKHMPKAFSYVVALKS